jgi:hypothetical protein
MTNRIQPNSPTIRAAFHAVLFGTLLLAHAATANNIRYHGLTLSDQYRLQLEEVDGTVTIFLLKKDRAAGGPAVPAVRSEKTTDEIPSPVIPTDTREALAQIRVEILQTAAPNYVRNPGDRYRITIDGQETAPGYTRTFEVNAADALTAVYTEFAKIFSTTYGIRREALYQGALVSLRILNEAQRLPAELPLTTKRSKVGQFRIQGDTLSRGKVAIPKFARIAATARATQDPRPTYWGTRNNREHAAPFNQLKRNRATPSLGPTNSTSALGPITPIHQPGISPYASTQNTTIEMLQGAPLESPMQLRAQRANQQP